LLLAGLPAVAGVKQVLEQSGHARLALMDSGETALQHRNLRLRKGDNQVVILSMGHLGTRKYYRAIQDYLARQKFDAVLYEDLHSRAAFRQIEQACGADLRLVHNVGEGNLRAKALDLVYQWDAMDFNGDRFLYADLAATSLTEEVAGIKARAASLRKQYQAGRGEPFAAMDGATLDAAIARDRAAMYRKGGFTRKSLARNAMATHVPGGDEDRREAHALEVLRKSLAGGRSRAFAMVFGAAHTDSFLKALLAEGFRETGHGWSTVFTY